MELSYGQLEHSLAMYLRIHPDKVPTLRSRIKQLQRLQFPPGVNVGRGAKMMYTREHLFQMAIAFELIGCAVPAQTACQVASRHWEEFGAGIALAMLNGRRMEMEVSDVHAVIQINALHELQISSTGAPVSPSAVQIVDSRGLSAAIATLGSSRRYTRIVICLTKLMSDLTNIARSDAGVRNGDLFQPDFHDWLPGSAVEYIMFADRYPDRSNLKLRQRLHNIFRNDPDSETAAGAAEASAYRKSDFGRISNGLSS